MNSQILELDTLLKPGVWMVAVIYGGQKVATTEFLITPQLSDTTKHFVIENNTYQKAWGKYLTPISKSAAGRQEKPLLTESDISSYLDKAVVSFYAIQDICYVGRPPRCMEDSLTSNWQLCSSTDWSSFSRDPKSELP